MARQLPNSPQNQQKKFYPEDVGHHASADDYGKRRVGFITRKVQSVNDRSPYRGVTALYRSGTTRRLQPDCRTAKTRFFGSAGGRQNRPAPVVLTKNMMPSRR